jgi:hypothetical protein
MGDQVLFLFYGGFLSEAIKIVAIGSVFLVGYGVFNSF